MKDEFIVLWKIKKNYRCRNADFHNIILYIYI